MAAFGLIEMLLLAITANGGATNDLVGLVPTEDYFQAQNIEVKLETMLELGGAEPTTGQKQVRQLLAIRWLGQNPEAVKEKEGARKLLEQIAGGKKGNDKHGFARLYAQRALARLDKKPLPVPHLPKGGDVSKREHLSKSLRVFPMKCDMVGVVDLRSQESVHKGEEARFREIMTTLARQIPRQDRVMVYSMIDSMGNVRLDRMSIAFEWKPGDLARGELEPERIMIHFQGACTSDWIAPVWNVINKGQAVVQTKKDPGGRTIRISQVPNSAPGFALIGDEELIIAGYQDNQGKHLEVVEAMLKARSGKEKTILEGELGKHLRDLPKTAVMLGAARFTENYRKAVAMPPLPEVLLAHGLRGKDLKIQVSGAYENETAAKNAVETYQMLKAQGLRFLRGAPRGAMPPGLANTLMNALNNTNVAVDGTKAKGSAALTQAMVKALLQSVLVGSREIAPVPPPGVPVPPPPPPPGLPQGKKPR